MACRLLRSRSCGSRLSAQETSINTKKLGQTGEVLEELQLQLGQHAAKITEIAPRSKRLGEGAPDAPAKRSRSSSAASSLSGEGTDTGEPASRQRKRPRMSDDESNDESS